MGDGRGPGPVPLVVAVAVGKGVGVAVGVMVGGIVAATGAPDGSTPPAPVTCWAETQTRRPLDNSTRYQKPPGSWATSGTTCPRDSEPSMA